jgi:hypothetical protein
MRFFYRQSMWVKKIIKIIEKYDAEIISNIFPKYYTDVKRVYDNYLKKPESKPQTKQEVPSNNKGKQN